VTRDPFLKFGISTPTKIWRDIPQNFDKSHRNFRFFAFLRLSGDFGRAVTSGRFNKDRRDP
jgi:hypothetical protein